MNERARARTAWPGFDVPDERFAAYVRERGEEALRIDELFLACACADRVPQALAAFEEHCMSVVAPALGRLGATSAQIEEIEQRLREYLFVEGKIVNYGGRGTLRGWLRVIAVRMARKQLVRDGAARTISEDAVDLVAGRDADPHLAALKRRYHDEFKRAIQDALAAESIEARNLLRHCLLDGLSFAQIGYLYQVDKATISRRLAKIRDSLASATRRALRARLQLSGSEVESIARLIESELDASLPRLLGA